MPCKTYPVGEGFAIVCSRGRRETCGVAGCRETSVALCDYPLAGAKKGTTCDKRLCRQHRASRGKEIDYCPAHARIIDAETGPSR
jgi:hypothetical protein